MNDVCVISILAQILRTELLSCSIRQPVTPRFSRNHSRHSSCSSTREKVESETARRTQILNGLIFISLTRLGTQTMIVGQKLVSPSTTKRATAAAAARHFPRRVARKSTFNSDSVRGMRPSTGRHIYRLCNDNNSHPASSQRCLPLSRKSDQFGSVGCRSDSSVGLSVWVTLHFVLR